MSNQFATPGPAGGDPVDLDAAHGCLLLIEPISLETQIPTSYGPSDAVRATVVILDGPQAGREHEGALLFPTVLRSQLAAKIGQKVLGRLGKGEGKAGQSPPWLLSDPSQADIELATRYVQSRASGQFAAPASNAAPQQGGGNAQWPATQPQQAAPQPQQAPWQQATAPAANQGGTPF